MGRGGPRGASVLGGPSAGYFPNLSLRLLPGVGHFVPIEAPEEALAAIRAALAAAGA